MITLKGATGANPFTTNAMLTTVAFLHRRISIFGDLAGMLFMAIVTGYSGVLQQTPGYKTAVTTFVKRKAVQPSWGKIFSGAIGGTYLSPHATRFLPVFAQCYQHN